MRVLLLRPGADDDGAVRDGRGRRLRGRLPPAADHGLYGLVVDYIG